MKQKLPDKNDIIYTIGGFGVKSISRESIKKNIETLRQIAKQGKEFENMNFKEWEKRYKCECPETDSYGCHDCQNTGYMLDSEECGFILTQNEENEKLKQENQILVEELERYKQLLEMTGVSDEQLSRL